MFPGDPTSRPKDSVVGVMETLLLLDENLYRGLYSKLHNYRWQEISLTTNGDNSFNLVLSLSKDVRLETA